VRKRLEERMAHIEDERARLLAAAQADVERETERVRALLQEAERDAERERLAAAAAKLQAARDAEAQAAARLAERFRPRRTRQPREPRVPAGPPPESIEAGDLVWLRGMDRSGEAIAAPDARGEVEVRLGPLRSRVKLSQVERVERPAPQRSDRPLVADLPVPVVAAEFDMRGQTVDEAVPAVERYLDDAFRAGLASARIIHGKGTGTLRRHVRDLLAKHALVTSYEEAQLHDGGEGVTIVHLAV
jgi:DNA mismatch repair protein MutS2